MSLLLLLLLWGVESQAELEFPESGFWPGVGVGVSHLKDTPTLDPVCFIWTTV